MAMTDKEHKKRRRGDLRAFDVVLFIFWLCALVTGSWAVAAIVMGIERGIP